MMKATDRPHRVLRVRRIWVLALALACVGAGLALRTQAAAQDDEPAVQGQSSAEVARNLSSRDAGVRQRAAEELARLASVEHRRLLEGYRLQEKDGRVRVALDWALYRAGKDEALFALVRALDSKRTGPQAFSYLTQLEGPAPLYVFLERVNGNTLIKLLDVLARTGDRETIERVKPFAASLDPGIAEAAKFAEHEITVRLAESPTVAPKRQRKTENDEDTTP